MSKPVDVTLATLRKLGHDCGFDAIGATTAQPFPELQERLLAYEDRGLTGFEWSDIADRVNPERWMPGCQSLIAVAMAYLTPAGHDMAHRHPPGSRADGRVTVYSYGADYHRVLTDGLNRLQQQLTELLQRPVAARVMVDTGPWVDRRIAERAGIGWIGKNCMMYSAEHGSYVFLGTLAVDVVVEPAAAELPAKCGDCVRCLQACPTGALIAPGVIDAPRCLSYVTQMKGVIPEPFRKPLGKRVWGCDTCQTACPENTGVRFSDHREYLPNRELAFPELMQILRWSNRDFQRMYGHTAAAWRGVRTWQRNALIALGNCKNERAIPDILPFLQHPRRELRASAAWALRMIDPLGTRVAVAQAWHAEIDPAIRAEMAWAVDDSAG